MDGRIAVHVLCPGSGMRMKTAADITSRISLAGEIIMLDHSPMFIKRIQADYKSDYLKEGQVFITGHYGILRYRAVKQRIMDTRTNITSKEACYMATGQKDNKEGQVLSAATDNKKKAKQEGSVYTLHELAADAQAVFGVMPDIVAAALREKGITKCTKHEAQKIIQDFVKREVK